MPPKKGVSYAEFAQMTISFPHVKEATAYGTPIFNVKKKMMVRVLEDGETIVIKIEPTLRSSLLDAGEKAFYITDHYAGHPLLLVRLGEVEKADLQYLLEQAWRFVATTRMVAEFEKSSA
jgi:hypothetical protein